MLPRSIVATKIKPGYLSCFCLAQCAASRAQTSSALNIHRTAWAPQFYTGSVERHARLMNGCMRVLVQRLAPAAASGEALDIYPLLRDATMVSPRSPLSNLQSLHRGSSVHVHLGARRSQPASASDLCACRGVA